MSAVPLCVVRDLNVWAGSKALAAGVSFEIGAGQVLGLVGPSGAGKSTIAFALARLLAPGLKVTGSVWFEPHPGAVPIDLLNTGERTRRALLGPGLAFVFQDPSGALHPLRRVSSAFADVQRRAKVPRAARRAQALAELEALGMAAPERVLAKFPHTLSGGERQRVALALALVGRPRLLVLDEPTSMLDSVRALEFSECLCERLAATGASALVVTHDVGLLIRLRADALLVDAGAVRARWSASTLREGHPLLEAVHPPWPAFSERAEAAAQATHAAEPVLELRDLRLTRGRGGFRSGPFDLDLRPARAIAVVGASGAGKSTLARLALALLPPDSGRVVWCGRAVSPGPEGARRPLRRWVQPVFQDAGASLDPLLTVRQTLALAHRAARRRDDLQAALLEMLAAVRLKPEHLERIPEGLSGGEQQRVAIARALLAEPAVLVLDEAFSALDRRVAVDILVDLDRWRRQRGTAWLLITHDLRLAVAVAQEVVVLDQGAVVERGSPADLCNRPRSAATRALLSAAGLWHGERKGEVQTELGR